MIDQELAQLVTKYNATRSSSKKDEYLLLMAKMVAFKVPNNQLNDYYRKQIAKEVAARLLTQIIVGW